MDGVPERPVGVFEALPRALRPLSDPPLAPGWNHAQMAELLAKKK